MGFVTVIAFIVLVRMDAFERFHSWSLSHESWQADELFSLSVVLVFTAAVYAWRRWQDLARESRLRAMAEDEVEILREILPICSFCSQIRTDVGAWKGLLEYMHAHSSIRFSHGVCPDCMKTHYSEAMDE